MPSASRGRPSPASKASSQEEAGAPWRSERSDGWSRSSACKGRHFRSSLVKDPTGVAVLRLAKKRGATRPRSASTAPGGRARSQAGSPSPASRCRCVRVTVQDSVQIEIGHQLRPPARQRPLDFAATFACHSGSMSARGHRATRRRRGGTFCSCACNACESRRH